jgi:hypothetical protein
MNKPINKRYTVNFLIIIPVIFTAFISTAQVSITGPQCAAVETTNQYEVKGIKPGSRISICVKGGIIIENNAGCIEKTSISIVRVKWIAGDGSGNISVSSSAGNASYSVNLTSFLNPGQIGSTKRQTKEFNSTPADLECSPASGGTCEPSYHYQWQESMDNLKWASIKDQTGQNLSFSWQLKETAFFRRMTTETVSNTVAYSAEAVVYVNADMTNATKK